MVFSETVGRRARGATIFESSADAAARPLCSDSGAAVLRTRGCASARPGLARPRANELRMRAALQALEDACHAGGRRQVDRAAAELSRLLVGELWVPDEDRAARVVAGLFRVLRRGAHLEQPLHYLRRMLRNQAVEAHRFRAREPRLSRDDLACDEEEGGRRGGWTPALELQALELAGLFGGAELSAPRATLEGLQRELNRYVRVYLRWAEEEGAAGARQVLTWSLARLHQATPAEVRAALCEPASDATIYQWGTRGARLVLRLAEADPDSFRGEVMRRAVEETSRRRGA